MKWSVQWDAVVACLLLLIYKQVDEKSRVLPDLAWVLFGLQRWLDDIVVALPIFAVSANDVFSSVCGYHAMRDLDVVARLRVNVFMPQHLLDIRRFGNQDVPLAGEENLDSPIFCKWILQVLFVVLGLIDI